MCANDKKYLKPTLSKGQKYSIKVRMCKYNEKIENCGELRGYVYKGQWENSICL